MPGLVGVEHRLGGQGRLEFLVRRADGGTGLFPGLLRAPQTDRDLQRAFEEALDDQARQPAHDRQIRNQGRELRSELPRDLVRQRRLRRASARATAPPMAAILDDVRLDGGQFRDLMASGITDGVARVQPVLAMATRLGDQINGLIRTLGGNQGARMPGMSGLPTGLASTLRAATAFALTAGEAIGGRRLRGRRRILLAQRQLSLQIGDALGLLGNLALAVGEFPSQALNLLLQALLGVLALLSLGPRHVSHGTPIGSLCTAP